MCCCNNVQKKYLPWSRTYFLFMSHFLIISIIILCRNTRKHIFHEWTHKVYNKTKNNNKENAKKNDEHVKMCRGWKWVVGKTIISFVLTEKSLIYFLYCLRYLSKNNVRLDFSLKMMIKNYYQRKLKEFFLLF